MLIRVCAGVCLAALVHGCSSSGDVQPQDGEPAATPVVAAPASAAPRATREASSLPVDDLVTELVPTLPADQSAPATRAAVVPAPAASSDPEVLVLLEQARAARQAGRLTHPPGFNARDFYQQALVREPGNAAARRGLEVVLQMSVQFALDAAHRGDYKTAELYLTRAGKFALQHPAIRGARRIVHEMSRIGRKDYRLNPERVRDRDPTLDEALKLITRRVVEKKAHLEIRAADDLQAIWLLDRMQHFAEDYPLHATIHSAASPRIRLTWHR